MVEKIIINNCRLYNDPAQRLRALEIADGTITAIRQAGQPADCRMINAGGTTAAPGFIDVHIQGAGGADVLDGTAEAIETIAQTCAKFGVTGWLATTVFKAGRANEHLRTAAECTGKKLKGAQLLGTHLEGPFIAAKKRGMIQPECLCEAQNEVMDEIERATQGTLSMMTIAPELPGVHGIIRRLTHNGTVASFGHSWADYEQTLAGFDAGINHVTHLFNAMRSMHHRKPGPLPAIMERDEVSVQVISDGVHIHPAVVRLACAGLGPKRIIPITDGMQAMGLPDGQYIYNGVKYQSKEGTARYADGTLIGTSLGLNLVLRRLVEFTGCSKADAINGVTAQAAKLLGIYEKKGSIEVGKDADIVLLRDDFAVEKTFVAGRLVYEA